MNHGRAARDGGLAILILLAVMFSKNHARPAGKDAGPVPLPVSTEVTQRKIQELEQDLSADQRQVAAQRAGQSPSPANVLTAMNPAQPGVASPVPQLPPAPVTERPRDPVADAEKALAFKARFASNLVSPEDGAARPSVDSTTATDNSAAGSASLSQAPAAQSPTAAAPIEKRRAPEVNVNAAHGQPYVVFEGTTIDTVLVNRLDGEFAEPLKVMVTNPVYSQNRQLLLISEGSFLLGGVQKVEATGKKRLAVTFHRMLMPDGYSVDLDQFHGLDQSGAAGLRDKINNHYVEIFGYRLVIPIAAYVSAKGTQIEGNGITPDISIPWSFESAAADKDQQLNSALDFLHAAL